MTKRDRELDAFFKEARRLRVMDLTTADIVARRQRLNLPPDEDPSTLRVLANVEASVTADDEQYGEPVQSGSFERLKFELLVRIAKRLIWRPIESAPKDGTLVLLFMPTSERQMCTARYSIGKHSQGWDTQGAFLEAVFTGRGHKPTHWMPLPWSPGPEPVR